MCRVSILTILLAMAAFLAGCTDEQSREHELYHQFQQEVAAQCGRCDTRLSLFFTGQEIMEARNPATGAEVYLAVVGTNGQSIDYCNQPAPVGLDRNGKVILKSPDCGKLKPTAIQQGKVIVE